MAVQPVGAPAGRVLERPGLATTSPPPTGRWLSRIAFIALLGAVSIFFIYPFVWLVTASLKAGPEVFNDELLPNPVLWENYARVFNLSSFAQWIWNSVLVSFLAAAAVTLSSAMVAFGFAYFRFPGRNALFVLVLATMMLPGAVLMIPTFLIWRELGFYNSLVPLWAGNLFGSAFYIFLMRQFFLGLPRELFEAARVDGASYLRMWWSVALPLMKPALIVAFVFELKASWTDLIKPLIYIRDVALFTLPRGLDAILNQPGIGGEQHWELVMAAAVITTAPMIVIFFIGQRYFIEGIATTGSKG